MLEKPQNQGHSQTAQGDHSIQVGAGLASGSAITTGGTTIIHNYAAGLPIPKEHLCAPNTLGGLGGLVSGLTRPEAKSFWKWHAKEFGHVVFADVDDRMLKRIAAYLHAIYVARK